MLLTALSIMIFVLETHSSCQVDRFTGRPIDSFITTNSHHFSKHGQTSDNPPCCLVCSPTVNDTQKLDPGPHLVLLVMDYICTSFFTVEFVVRATSHAVLQKTFWRSPLNIIDFICLPPVYINIAMYNLDIDNTVGRPSYVYYYCYYAAAAIF